MTTSFFNGISGAKSFQSGIDVWANNIANVNTIGYKQNIPEFSSIFAEAMKTSPITSDKSFGSVLFSTVKDFSQGSLVNTDNTFDLAIEGEGFFSVLRNNRVYYTRTGSFTFDKDRFLVDNDRNYLLVKNVMQYDKVDGSYVVSSNRANEVSKIMLPQNLIYPAKDTTEIVFDKFHTDFYSKARVVQPQTDFDTALNKDKIPLNLQNGQSIFIGYGDYVTYDKDKQKIIASIPILPTAKDTTYSFQINNKTISVEVKAFTSVSKIAELIAKELQKEGFDAKNEGDRVVIEESESLIIKNINNFVTLAGKKLTFNENPTNSNDFRTFEDFVKLNNEMLKNFDSSMQLVTGNLNVNTGGYIEICSNYKDSLPIKVILTENSNQNLYKELSVFNKTLNPNEFINSNPFFSYIYKPKFVIGIGSFGEDLGEIKKDICLDDRTNLKLTIDDKSIDLSNLDNNKIKEVLSKNNIKFSLNENTNTLTVWADKFLKADFDNTIAKKYDLISSTYSDLENLVNDLNKTFNTHLKLNYDATIENPDKTNFIVDEITTTPFSSHLKTLSKEKSDPILDYNEYHNYIYVNGEKKEISYYVTPEKQGDRLIILIDNKIVYDGKADSQIKLTNPNITINFNDFKNDFLNEVKTAKKDKNGNILIDGQDGYPKGELIDYDVSDNFIKAYFTNSKEAIIAQIPIYKFTNNQGLSNEGWNIFSPTSNSGAVVEMNDFYKINGIDSFVVNKNVDSYSKVISHTLEQSNVNLQQAMTELIVNQRAFQASAKTITTSDQMIQKAIEMKR